MSRTTAPMLAAVAAISILTMSACGGESDGDATGSAGKASSAPTTTPQGAGVTKIKTQTDDLIRLEMTGDDGGGTWIKFGPSSQSKTAKTRKGIKLPFRTTMKVPGKGGVFISGWVTDGGCKIVFRGKVLAENRGDLLSLCIVHEDKLRDAQRS